VKKLHALLTEHILINITAKMACSNFQEQRQESMVSHGPHAGLSKAKVFQGSNYYILLAEGAYGQICEQASHAVLPPLSIEGGTALYSLEVCPKMEPAVPYLKSDQLVSHRSLIPGLARFDANDRQTFTISHFLYTRLEDPFLLPTHSLEIQDICFSLDETVFKCGFLLHCQICVHAAYPELFVLVPCCSSHAFLPCVKACTQT
jgi:hypothetical protein